MAPSSAKPHKEFSFRTRQLAWDALKSRPSPLNVLIVGGGIVGAGLLRELALRGATDCVLVEKADFASGTSGASSKLIHAGLRYLEQAWNRLKEGRFSDGWRGFRFVLDASMERKTLGRLAPGLVRPKRIHVVLGRGDTRNSLSVLAGTWAYYAIQLLQGQFFPAPTACFSADSIRRTFPELAHDRVKSVFSFWDSETDDARLVIENLQGASDLGVTAMNYVALESYTNGPNGVTATLKNRESGESVVVTARVLINAGGPHVDEIRAKGNSSQPPLVDRVAGAHIDVHPALTERSFYITAPDERLVFVLHRVEDGLAYTRIGTTERPLAPEETSDSPKASAAEVRYLVNLAREFFPSAVIDAATVIGVDAGIRPLRAQTGLNAFQKSREHDIVADGRVFHIVGVKLTDFRRVASEIASTVPWRSFGVTVGSARSLALRPEGERIYREATTEECVLGTMALHWDDYMLRRRGAATRVSRRDDPARLEKELGEMSRLLGWPQERVQSEKARVTPPSLPA